MEQFTEFGLELRTPPSEEDKTPVRETDTEDRQDTEVHETPMVGTRKSHNLEDKDM